MECQCAKDCCRLSEQALPGWFHKWDEVDPSTWNNFFYFDLSMFVKCILTGEWHIVAYSEFHSVTVSNCPEKTGSPSFLGPYCVDRSMWGFRWWYDLFHWSHRWSIVAQPYSFPGLVVHQHLIYWYIHIHLFSTVSQSKFQKNIGW